MFHFERYNGAYSVWLVNLKQFTLTAFVTQKNLMLYINFKQQGNFTMQITVLDTVLFFRASY